MVSRGISRYATVYHGTERTGEHGTEARHYEQDTEAKRRHLDSGRVRELFSGPMPAAGHGLPADTQRFVALQMVPRCGAAAKQGTSRASYGCGRFEELRKLWAYVSCTVQSGKVLQGMRGEGTAEKGR